MGSKRRLKIRGFIFLIGILIFIGYGIIYTTRVIQPALKEIGQVAARGIITELTAEAVKTTFIGEKEIEDILEIRKDDSGKITMVSTNGVAISKMGSALGESMQQKMLALEPKRIKIPLGSIFASALFSQTGPDIKIKVEPLGVAKVTVATRFEERGINQTKYKVLVKVGSDVRVLAPFSKSEIKVNNEYLIAEVVIVGDVPGTYVITTKEDLLDAISLD
ncbi:MAG: sporulation protein YunB [Anaerovoracaceae bacterium]